MRYFIDTEFIEDGRTIDLISIGIYAEDGRTYYAQNTECDFTKASDWVWRNVFPFLDHFDMRGVRMCSGINKTYDSGLGHRSLSWCEAGCPWRKRREIAEEVIKFCEGSSPEFWGYYADYDWVVFCQLFGKMIDLPIGFPMYCRDLKQLMDAHPSGGVKIPKNGKEHNALADAIWNGMLFNSLK